ncbi:MAG: cytochrome c3 family protein [Planctomycetota bacterium]|nr:cytochrome c3 family protein [Planctomycetota bacterium]
MHDVPLTYVETFAHNVHRGQSCEQCHGPASLHVISRGTEPGTILSFKKLAPAASAELCLQCHEQDACTPGGKWRFSTHAHKGVTCVDCHRSHYNVPLETPATNQPGADVSQETKELLLKLVSHAQLTADADNVSAKADGEKKPSLGGTSRALGAISPNVCYRCHKEEHAVQAIAGPHQIGGENGFNCTTCHDSHGKLLQYSRKDLCLKCHTDAPTSAWHSSSHELAGVACTDCHNPHPHSKTQQLMNIDHTQVRRKQRMPMSVDDPNACFKCHTDMYARSSMPSHHPIKEGKMVCGDCHDGHGQSEGNLKEATVNMVCSKCHAEKAGPFAYEHPPVTENCSICHNPHGTVTNNLLHQPASFLCLRCHTGHRTGPNFGPHGILADVGKTPSLQKAFYSDCTQCHAQVHGSDHPSPHNTHSFLR